MATGFQTAQGSITTNTDTAVIAAPGVGAQIYILWVTLTTSVVGTTSRLRIERGAGGAVLGRMATVTVDALLNLNYTTADPNFPGRPLGDNVALNINTNGAAAATLDYDIGYIIRGRQ